MNPDISKMTPEQFLELQLLGIEIHSESGSYCEFYKDFLDDFLVNFKCPRAVRFGCLGDPKCPNVGYAQFINGRRI